MLTQTQKDFLKESSQRLNELDTEAMGILDAIEASFPIGEQSLEQLEELLLIVPAGLFRSDIRTRIKELKSAS